MQENKRTIVYKFYHADLYFTQIPHQERTDQLLAHCRAPIMSVFNRHVKGEAVPTPQTCKAVRLSHRKRISCLHTDSKSQKSSINNILISRSSSGQTAPPSLTHILLHTSGWMRWMMRDADDKSIIVTISREHREILMKQKIKFKKIDRISHINRYFIKFISGWKNSKCQKKLKVTRAEEGS